VVVVVSTEAVGLLEQQRKAVETAGHLEEALETPEQQILEAAVAAVQYRQVQQHLLAAQVGLA
jgi:hypothetical protein